MAQSSLSSLRFDSVFPVSPISAGHDISSVSEKELSTSPPTLSVLKDQDSNDHVLEVEALLSTITKIPTTAPLSSISSSASVPSSFPPSPVYSGLSFVQKTEPTSLELSEISNRSNESHTNHANTSGSENSENSNLNNSDSKSPSIHRSIPDSDREPPSDPPMHHSSDSSETSQDSNQESDVDDVDNESDNDRDAGGDDSDEFDEWEESRIIRNRRRLRVIDSKKKEIPSSSCFVNCYKNQTFRKEYDLLHPCLQKHTCLVVSPPTTSLSEQIIYYRIYVFGLQNLTGQNITRVELNEKCAKQLPDIPQKKIIHILNRMPGKFYNTIVDECDVFDNNVFYFDKSKNSEFLFPLFALFFLFVSLALFVCLYVF